MLKIILLFLVHYTVTVCNALDEESEVIVTLPNGKIQGHFLKTFNDVTYLAYQEIPFASPPIGQLRFMDPIPPKNWDGILNTTENTKICFQYSPTEGENEDCLYLNVYTPVDENFTKLSNLSVLCYIYGGGFVNGDYMFEHLGPEFFIEQNIVVVTLNYRLGAFGFLSTQDTVIAGNQALKDQNLALKWVNTNIHLFGGNPSKVTIMGESAGAASVGFQVISKKSEGLFRAAILESSTAICSWVYQSRAKELAYQLAAAVEPLFTIANSSEDLLHLLQSIPAEDIRNAVIPGFPSMGVRIGQGLIWAPVIEPQVEESFITDSMDENLKNGEINQVPLIIGVNSEERIYLAKNLTEFEIEMSEFDRNVSLLVNEDFNINDADILAAGEALRSIYTDETFQSNLGPAVRFMSDSRFTTSVIRHAELQSEYTDVYFYQFSYDGEMGDKLNIHVEGADTVNHAAELNYLWSSSANRNLTKFPATDVTTHRRLVKLWANFVKYLNPTPVEDDLFQNMTWPTVSSNDFKYININITLEIKTDPKEYKNWKKVVDTYGHPPFITY